MLSCSCVPEVPLLIVVEGENDVCFLKTISSMLHRDNPDLPNLSQLTNERRIVFLPTGGNNLYQWVQRINGLHKRAFYLFDREQEPETVSRRQVVDAINQHSACRASLTHKRALENYLHPLAIFEACAIDFCFDDDTDVASLLALRMLTRNDCRSSWRELPHKRQRRLHDRAKKTLNVKAVERMTPSLLAQQDPAGEVVGWLQAIRGMLF